MPHPRPSPTVRARRLRHELRRLREERNLTIEQVSAQSEGDFANSTLSRWETGDRSIRPVDLRRLLDIYDVQDEQREILLMLARQARERGWWQTYGSAIPQPFKFFVGLESEADAARTYEAELVPGLLQTADYYRAFLRAAPAAGNADEIETKIKVRSERQERLTADEPLTLWAVINEAVIRRVVGGVETMREQLHHVAEMAQLPHVTVQVLPFRAGAHPSMEGPFTILTFPDPRDPDVTYLENQAGSLYVEEAPQVDRYNLIHGHLVAKALDPDESGALITQVANELD